MPDSARQWLVWLLVWLTNSESRARGWGASPALKHLPRQPSPNPCHVGETAPSRPRLGVGVLRFITVNATVTAGPRRTQWLSITST